MSGLDGHILSLLKANLVLLNLVLPTTSTDPGSPGPERPKPGVAGHLQQIDTQRLGAQEAGGRQPTSSLGHAGLQATLRL